MIARVFIPLPFDVWISAGQEYAAHRYRDAGYEITIHPLQKVGGTKRDTTPDELTIDGSPAVCASGLKIDFKKASFNRGETAKLDPPEELISRTVNSFIGRLRYLLRAPHLQPIDLYKTNWQVFYYNDDETKLEEQEGLRTGYRTQTMQFSMAYAVATPDTWTKLHELGPGYELPLWAKLLLDGQYQAPHIGPIIVLSMTALEVFISGMLDGLARAKKVSPDFWKWLIYRQGQYLQEPSNEDRFDALLKFLVGHSLKEEKGLWTSFKQLKEARNSVVHSGTALIGKRARIKVDLQKALELSAEAWKITEKIGEWSPEELHWPAFAPPSRVQAKQTIFRRQTSSTPERTTAKAVGESKKQG